MQGYTVGLDVHSGWTTYAIEDSGGELVARGRIPTTPQGLEQLQRTHALEAGTKVGLETGTVSFYVARQLRALALEPVVVDAHEVRLKAHRPRQKCDRRDAAEVCQGVRRGIYRSIVHVPPARITALRETIAQRRHFVRVKTAQVNAVKRHLRAAGLGHLSRSLKTDRNWDGLLSLLPAEGSLPTFVSQHRQLWRSANEEVATLERSLESQAKAFAESVRRLQTVPSVGPIVALTAIATFSDVSRFPSSHHAASYIGIVPATYQSGERDTNGHVTKRGASELRAMLCQSAQHARRPDHPLHPYFARLCAARGYKLAVVAVAHRLCRILFAMLRDETEFHVRHLGIEAGSFETRVVRPYRLKKRVVGA